MKKYIAECFGTFVLTFLGCGTAMFLGCGEPAGVVGTAIAFGLAVVAMAGIIPKTITNASKSESSLLDLFLVLLM